MRLSWASTIGIAFLTGIAGAASAGYVTYLWTIWYRLRGHDGGDLGYYILFIPAGLLAGLLLGALISRNVSGFWAALGVSIAVMVGLCVVVGAVGRMYGEIAPELDGDELVLQVEVKLPKGWQPDNDVVRPEGRGCTLQPLGPGRRVGSRYSGTVDWKKASQVDGQWVAPCEVLLFSSRETRFVDLNLGKTWVGFSLRLPAHPTRENEQWSQWFTDGFSQEVGKPPMTGYAYRCRVKREGEIRDEAAAAANAFFQAREQAAAAVPDDAPAAKWIPLFEDPDGTPASYRWGGADRRERRMLAPRVLELAPLLESGDRTVTRQAVFALGSLQETPSALVEPLIAAGRMAVTLIDEAKAATAEAKMDAETKASRYFDMWSNAMTNAGPAAAPKFRPMLEEIERDASTGGPGDLEIVARRAKEFLGKIATA